MKRIYHNYNTMGYYQLNETEIELYVYMKYFKLKTHTTKNRRNIHKYKVYYENNLLWL